VDTVEEDVVVKAKTERILAIDLLRGFLLLVIMADHIELYPNGWDFFTGKGRLWVSAAEGFFFLSGLLIGMIYKRRLHLGMKFIFKKMWQRALELYIVGTALTFVFLGWVELTNHVPIKDTLPDPIPWGHYIWQALTLRFTYGWADFLVHFAALMVIAPFIFYLVARRKWWLALVGITVMWLYRGEHFTLAWQAIFNLGIIIGFYWQEIKQGWDKLKAAQRRLIKRVIVALAAVSFVASYASVFLLSLLNHLYDSLTPWLRHVTFTWNNYNADIWVYADKWKMGWLRIILFFLWFMVLYWISRRYERQIGRATRGLLELLGRNSLYVYTAHAFIVFILKMYVIPPQTSVVQNFLITGAALAALIAVTIAYKRLEPKLSWPRKLAISQIFSR
jgi:hypothetical protein